MDSSTDINRIRRMTEVVKRVSEGDLTVQVALSGRNDAYDELAVELNSMILDMYSQYQEKLSGQKQFFESILNRIPMEVVIFNRDHQYVFVNPFAVKDPEMRKWLIGKSNYEYCDFRGLDKRIAEERETLFEKAHEKGDTVSIEQISVDKDGRERHYLRMISPLPGKNGDVDLLIGYGIDITERKEKEALIQSKNEALEKANMELDQFVYRASHDLRAPLASVLGLVSLAELEESSPALGKYLSMIKSSVSKLDNFIQDIVQYSQNARQDQAWEKVDLEAMASESFQNLQFLKQADKIDFRVDIQGECMLYSDSFRIGIMLNNLISNAIKYHDLKEAPYVQVRAFIEKDQARIEVEDNGQGIPEEFQKKVFDMFYRASTQAFGTGIGLYIVREVADKLQGKITLESTSGEGSCFQIILPNRKPIEAEELNA